ncbi:hypothetical protein MTP99_009541 [Tenebrio molitor]|nr:hypothetical protein MTP99_009541 [Tenebrio molitor]
MRFESVGAHARISRLARAETGWPSQGWSRYHRRCQLHPGGTPPVPHLKSKFRDKDVSRLSHMDVELELGTIAVPLWIVSRGKISSHPEHRSVVSFALTLASNQPKHTPHTLPFSFMSV